MNIGRWWSFVSFLSLVFFFFCYICLRAQMNVFWMAVSRKLVTSITESTVKLYEKRQRERRTTYRRAQKRTQITMWLCRTYSSDETKTKQILAQIHLLHMRTIRYLRTRRSPALCRRSPSLAVFGICRNSHFDYIHAMEFGLNTFETRSNVSRSCVWSRSLSHSLSRTHKSFSPCRWNGQDSEHVSTE